MLTPETSDIPPHKPMPLVSVLMTSYNRAAYLPEALASVFAQTYPNLELILVDDGSTDNSRETIQRHMPAPPPFRVEIITKENGGQASALNRAYTEARGDLIALIDCDDVWHPEKVAQMVAFAAQHPGGGVYQHQVDDGLGHPFRNLLVSGDLFGEWRRLGEVNLVIHPRLAKVNIPTSGLVFRRAVLEEIMPIPESLLVCPDFYLFVLGCSRGPLFSHPSTLAQWRSHEANAGREDRFSFKNYWLPTLIPTVNAALKARGHAVRFVFKRHAIFFEPLRLLFEAWRGRRQRRDGHRQ